MDKIYDNLYIGNWEEAANARLLASVGITAIFNLARERNDPVWDGPIVWVKCGIWDGPGNRVSDIELAVNALGQLFEDGHRVMAHCAVGASRTPYICALAVARRSGRAFDEVLAEIKQRRPRTDIPNRLIPLYGNGSSHQPISPSFAKRRPINV